MSRLAWIALTLALLAPSVATAQARRVALCELEGRGAPAVRRRIERGLGERGITVLACDARVSTDAEAAAVARETGAEAVVSGAASSRRRAWRAHLSVRDAMGGVQAEVQQRGRGAALGRLITELADALELVPTAASPEAPPVVVASSAPSSPSTPERTAPAEPASTEPPPVRALLQVGAGLRTRAFELLSPDGIDAGYRAEPYFEVAARASARFLDVLFVRAVFGSSVGLTSEREEPSLGTLESLFVHVRGDAGASVVLDRTVELGAAFGVGWDRYELTFNEVVPTTEYVHLRPALVTGFRLIGELLVLDAEIGVRVPFGVGDLEALHGVDYDVIGLDGVARLGGVVDPGFAWTLEVGARHYWIEMHRPDGDVTGFDAGWHATAFAGWQL